MKLHDATKQLVTQFGQKVVTEVRLANLLADLNGYQEYPAMKQVFRDLLKDGYGQKLFDAYQKGSSEAISKAADFTTTFALDSHFKEDLVSYGFDCLLWALDCIKTINEPMSKGFDPMSKGDAELLDNLPDKLSALQKQYLDLLDRLIVLPKDLLVNAPAYYTVAAHNQLYALEAKIAAIMEQLGKTDYAWCKKQRDQKLSFYHQKQNAAIAKDKKAKAEAEERRRKRQEAEEEAERKRLAEEKKKKQIKYTVGGFAAAAIMGVSAFGVGVISSQDDIALFEQTIQQGEQRAAAGNYGQAIQLFEDAKTNYTAFRSSHYHDIADEHIAANVEKATTTCGSLIEQGKLMEAKNLVSSLPTAIIESDPTYSEKVKSATAAIEQAAQSGFEELINNVSNNKGHLDAAGKAKLNELLKLNPEDYWLNIIKNKEL